jgi:hypothetical protein
MAKLPRRNHGASHGKMPWRSSIETRLLQADYGGDDTVMLIAFVMNWMLPLLFVISRGGNTQFVAITTL